MSEKINVRQLIVILICNTIGTGVFFLPKIIVINAQTVTMSLLCWVFSAIISILFGLCYSELGSSYPVEGGDTIYLSKAYGSYAGLIFSAVSVIAILPLGSALMAKNIVEAFDIEKSKKVILVIVLLAILSVLNYLGGQYVYKMQFILTILKILTVFLFTILAAFVFIGLIDVKKDVKPFLKQSIPNKGYNIKKIIIAIYSTLWSYDGWNSGNFIAHRVKKPYRTFPIAITLSLIIVSSLYILINISYFYVLSYERLTDANSNIITDYFQTLSINTKLAYIFASIINIIPPLGTLSGSFLVSISIVDSFISKTRNVKLYKVISLISFSLVILLLYILGEAEAIVEKINFFVFLFYGASVCAIFTLRKQKERALKIYRANNIIVGICAAFSAFILSFAIYKKFVPIK